MNKIYRYLCLLVFIITQASGFESFAGKAINEKDESIVTFSNEDCKKTGIKGLKLHSGETMLPMYDGKHYFIDVDGMQNTATGESPDKLAIQTVVENAQNAGKVVEINSIESLITGAARIDFRSLPLVLHVNGASLDFNVVLLSLTFKTNAAFADIGVVSTSSIKNGNGDKEIFYLGARNIEITNGGGIKGQFSLISPKTLELFDLRGYGQLNLGVGTGFCLGCENGTKSFIFNLNGTFDFDPSVAIAEKEDGTPFNGDNSVPQLAFGLSFEKWDDLVVGLKLPTRYGIQFKAFSEVGFWDATGEVGTIPNSGFCTSIANINSNIILDLSDSKNPIVTNPDFTLPADFKGLLINNMQLRLPKGVRESGQANATSLRVSLDHFFIDKDGVDAIVALNNPNGLFGKKYKLGDGFDITLTDLGFGVSKHQLSNFLMKGNLRLPTFKENDYALRFGIQFNNPPGTTKTFKSLSFTAGVVSSQDKFDFRLFSTATVNADLKVCGISANALIVNGDFEGLAVEVDRGDFSFKANNFDVLGAHFQKLVITNKKPFVKEAVIFPSHYSYTCAQNESLTNTNSDSGASGLSIGGFGLSFSNLTLKGDANTDKVTASAATTVELGQKGDADATGLSGRGILSFVADRTYNASNDQYSFELKDFKISQIEVEANFGAFGFSGRIDWFKNEERFGITNATGFAGDASFWVNMAGGTSKPDSLKGTSSPNETSGAGVSLIFLTVNQDKPDAYKAWAVDVSLNFPSAIPVGPVSIKGIFGGAYRNMTYYGDKTSGTKTGFKYRVIKGKWGFNIGLDMVVTGTDAAGSTAAKPGGITINAMLAAEGTDGHGLDWIKGMAYAKFNLDMTDLIPPIAVKMTDNLSNIANQVAKISQKIPIDVNNPNSGSQTEPVKDIASNAITMLNKAPVNDGKGNRVGAGVVVTVNFGNADEPGYFQMILKPDINVHINTKVFNNSIQTTGYGILYLGKDEKGGDRQYLHLGKSDRYNRLGLQLDVSAGGGGLTLDASVFVNAYFMIGNYGIANELPDPLVPDKIAQAFGMRMSDIKINKSTNPDDYSAVRDGTGVAFGAAIGVHVDFTAAYVFSVNVDAGVGVDALIVNRGMCDNSKPGWESGGSDKSWRAAAQVYGYADLGVNVLGLELASAGVAFLLRANVPKPFYAEGQFYVYAKIWFASVNLQITGKFGEGCLDPETVTKTEKVKMIKDLSPSGINKMAPTGSLLLTCEYPWDQTTATYKNWNGMNSTDFRQEIRIKITDSEGNVENIVRNNIDPKNFSNHIINLKKDSDSKYTRPVNTIIPVLKKNEHYKVEIYTRIYDAQYQTVKSHDESTNTDLILEDTHEYDINTTDNNTDIQEQDIIIYPGKNQYNVYASDFNGKGYLKLMAEVAAGINQSDAMAGYYLQFYKDGIAYESPIKLTTWDEDIALPSLLKNTIYEIRIIQKGTASGTEYTCYKDHFFRTANFDNFKGKIAEINNAHNASYQTSPDMKFDISYTGSKDIDFSKEEIEELVKLKIAPDNWFDILDDMLNTLGLRGNTSRLRDMTSILQNKTLELKNGVTGNTPNNAYQNLNPIFTYAPFDLDFFMNLLDSYNRCVAASQSCQQVFRDKYGAYGVSGANGVLPNFVSGDYCIQITYDLNKFSYFKDRAVVGSLPVRFAKIDAALCFNNTADRRIDIGAFQQEIKVSCQRQKYDSQGLLLNFKLTKEGIEVPFPVGLDIKNSNYSVFKNNTNTESYKVLAPKSLATFISTKVMSSGSCPTSVNDFFTDFPNKYQFVLAPEIAREHLQTCFAYKDVTREHIAELLEQTCRETYKNRDDIEACISNGGSSTLNISSNKKFIQVKNYEDNSYNNTQNLDALTNIVFSNSNQIWGQIKKDDNSLIIAMNDSDIASGMKVLSENQTCGANLQSVITTPTTSYRVIGYDADRTKACSAANASWIYSTTAESQLQKGVSQFYSNVSSTPFTLLSSGYYVISNGNNQRKYIYINNGIYQETNFCASNPIMEARCGPVMRTDYNQPVKTALSICFYTDQTKTQTYIPSEIPNDGLKFQLSNGSILHFDKSEINNGCVSKEMDCTGISVISSNIGLTILTPPGTNCASKPDAPTLTASATLVNFGESVTLTTSGCNGGQIVWSNAKSTATITEIINEDKYFSVQCLNNNCLSNATSQAIKVKALTIKTSNGNNYVCAGSLAKLIGDGCLGTINWTSNDNNLTIPNATSAAIEVNINKNTLFKFTCTTNVAGIVKSLTETKQINYYEVAAKPVIASNVPGNQNGNICLGETIIFNTTTTCQADKTLNWSTGSTDAGITVSPTVNTTYFATCNDSYCSSAKSNEVAITINKLQKANVVSNLLNNAVCVNKPFTLTGNNCEAGDIVYWYKEGVATAFGTGNSITLTALNTQKYLAKCRRSISTDNTKWCEGTISDAIEVKALSDAEMIMTLVANKQQICTYEKSQLTATGCDFGIAEWQLPDGIWSALSGNAKNYAAATAGTYKVRCNLNGCLGAEALVNIVVNPEPPSPVLSTNKTNNTICAGERIQLSGSCSFGDIVWQNLPENPIGLAHTDKFLAVCKTGFDCMSQIPASIIVNVNPIPQKLLVNSSSGNPICEYNQTNITAIGCNGTVYWTDNSRENPIANFQRQQGDYNFAAKCEERGCIGPQSDNFRLIVYNRPAKPVIGISNNNICSGAGSMTMIVNGCIGANIKWSDGDTSPIKTFSNAGGYDYKVQCIQNNCESEWSDTAHGEIRQTPNQPGISSSNGWVICEYNPTNISAGCENNTYPVWSNNNLNNVHNSGEYRVYCQSNNGCRSHDSQTENLVVYNRPAKPVIGISNNNICSGTGSMTMSVNGCNGANIKWSDGDTSPIKTFSNAGGYDYRVQCIQNNCESEWSDNAHGQIRQTPNQPGISGPSTLCEGQSTNINTGCQTGSVVWKNAPQNIGSVGSYNYTAVCQNNGCESSTSGFTQTVYSYPGSPSITEDRQCGKTILSVNNCGGSVSWSNGASANAIEIFSQTNITAYCSQNGCVSSTFYSSQDVKANANNLILFIANDYGQSCGDRPIWLGASGCNGSVSWEQNPGEREGNYAKFNLTQTTTYRVNCVTNGGCSGSKSDITIVRKDVPPTPVLATSVSNCQNVISLSNNCNGSIVWHDFSHGGKGVVLPVYTTSEAKLVFAECESAGCKSALSNGAFVSAINTQPSWQYGEAYCSSDQRTTYRNFTDNNPCSNSNPRNGQEFIASLDGVNIDYTVDPNSGDIAVTVNTNNTIRNGTWEGQGVRNGTSRQEGNRFFIGNPRVSYAGEGGVLVFSVVMSAGKCEGYTSFVIPHPVKTRSCSGWWIFETCRDVWSKGGASGSGPRGSK